MQALERILSTRTALDRCRNGGLSWIRDVRRTRPRAHHRLSMFRNREEGLAEISAGRRALLRQRGEFLHGFDYDAPLLHFDRLLLTIHLYNRFGTIASHLRRRWMGPADLAETNESNLIKSRVSPEERRLFVSRMI